MPDSSTTAKLEQRIARYFEKYSAKRIALASVIVGVAAFGGALIAYMLTLSSLISIGTFLLMGLIFVNIAILMVVPPVKELHFARDLLISAVNRPALIQRVDRKGVQINDSKGKVHTLKGYQQKAWDEIITPFFFSATASRGKVMRQALEAQRQGDTLAALDSKRDALMKQEAEFQEAQRRLELERAEFDRRNQELLDAENLVIDRLSQVEEAEAQMAQIRDDLNDSIRRQNEGATNSQDAAAYQAKEAELKAKEAEIEALKKDLLEDRQIVASQKTELNQMKGEMLLEVEKATGTSVDSSALDAMQALQQKLDARAKELEDSAKELEERSRYVDEAEESLVERLGQLTEREAYVQQGEINAGMRVDT